MGLEIVNVENHGDLSTERITLRATSNNVNIWNYLLTDTTYRGDGSISNKLRHVFDFDCLDAIILNSGDCVVLYTGKGTDQIVENSGVKIYIIHWGLNETIWNKDGDKAFLIKAESRTKKAV